LVSAYHLIEFLCRVPNLQRVGMTGADSETIEALMSKCPALQDLSLHYSSFSREDIVVCTRLRVLQLDTCQIDTAALEQLRHLSHLTTLSVCFENYYDDEYFKRDGGFQIIVTALPLLKAFKIYTNHDFLDIQSFRFLSKNMVDLEELYIDIYAHLMSETIVESEIFDLMKNPDVFPKLRCLFSDGLEYLADVQNFIDAFHDIRPGCSLNSKDLILLESP